MLISFHLPKAAGKSFQRSLSDFFDKTLLEDYSDYPMNTPPIKRNYKALLNSIKNRYSEPHNIKCIHGHFLPLKYRFLKYHDKIQFITWMRDPAERIASQYFYMLRNYTTDIGLKQPLYKRVIEENWSLEQYCLSPEFRNTCTQLLWGFPVQKFDFIGIVEDYENDLAFFSQKYLHTNLKGYRQNYNPSIIKQSYYDDPSFKEKVSQFHSKDVALYQYAQRLKQRRDDIT